MKIFTRNPRFPANSGARFQGLRKTLGSEQAGGEIKADTIKRDLNQRKAKNQKRMKLERALERFVLDLDLDWNAFHYLLSKSLKEVDCALIGG